MAALRSNIRSHYAYFDIRQRDFDGHRSDLDDHQDYADELQSYCADDLSGFDRCQDRLNGYLTRYQGQQRHFYAH